MVPGAAADVVDRAAPQMKRATVAGALPPETDDKGVRFRLVAFEFVSPSLLGGFCLDQRRSSLVRILASFMLTQ